LDRDSNFHPWNLLPIEHHKETGLHIANIVSIAVLTLLMIGLFATALIPRSGTVSTMASHSPAVISHSSPPASARR
jgi:hypothetical protein